MRSTISNMRIGERVHVSLQAQVQPIPRKSSLFSRSPKARKAAITNLSVSGAEIECVPLPVEVRDKATLQLPEGKAVVEIRRIEPVHKNRVRYGLQFLSIDPNLVVFFNQMSSGDRTDEIDWRWTTAR